MKLENYTPSSRGVLFYEVREEKTKGGIYIPKADFVIKTHADLFENEKEHKADQKIGDYIVVKVGKDVSEIKVSDSVIIMPGISPQHLVFEEGIYLQVPEMQIVGYERK
jgi:co-chaperonin GroES (HSP10)